MVKTTNQFVTLLKSIIACPILINIDDKHPHKHRCLFCRVASWNRFCSALNIVFIRYDIYIYIWLYTKYQIYIYIYGYKSKCKVRIEAPGPHTIHTPRSIPWSIPWSILHDPYPWSIPLSRWRKTDAGPNVAFYPNTASGPRTATPIATTVATTGATAAELLLLLLLSLLVIFLPGPAATAVASAAAPAVPARAAGAGSLPPCASGSWRNATSWLATSNIASTLEASKTGSSSTRCFLYF